MPSPRASKCRVPPASTEVSQRRPRSAGVKWLQAGPQWPVTWPLRLPRSTAGAWRERHTAGGPPQGDVNRAPTDRELGERAIGGDSPRLWPHSLNEQIALSGPSAQFCPWPLTRHCAACHRPVGDSLRRLAFLGGLVAICAVDIQPGVAISRQARRRSATASPFYRISRS